MHSLAKNEQMPAIIRAFAQFKLNSYARFEVSPKRHNSLGLDAYAWVTSPIRYTLEVYYVMW